MSFRGAFLIAALLGQALAVTPVLKDSSDKKFSANYPQDTRPVVDKKVLNKLKSDKEPYPALQAQAKYDTDFVKDENNDAGHWKAQFEYDALRKKMLKEEADEKAAADKAAKEGKDADDAQKNADDAAKKADAAKKDAEAAKQGEDAAKNAQDAAAKKKDDSKEKATQAELEADLAKAEKDYEAQQAKFKLCQQELDEAKARYMDLKAKVAEMQNKNAADVKLWAEQANAQLRASKEARQKRIEAASAKREAADLRFQAAEHEKSHLDDILKKEKGESDQAQKALQKERAEVQQAKAELDKSAKTLQKLKGYAPDAAPVKSGAAVPTTVFSFLVAMIAFMRL